MSPTIYVFSDVVCPWCYLGKRRLERALDQLGLAGRVGVHWLPFELNPDMPAEGMPRAEYRARKFGLERSAELDARMAALGEAEGVRFAFDRMTRTPSTRRAHMLIAHAAERGQGDAIVEALFRAYFEQARDIGNPGILVEVAAAVGFPPEEARAALDSEDLRARVLGLERRAAEMGIGGVPFFILEGGQAVSGAQPSEAWVEILRDAVPQRAAAGAGSPAGS
ncbi:DsbA family oxidoreductase [Enterovirga aerilata]|uniref:DsbA family oxidoreductase n=1 Tax=Enterovirga aerilata TaxID=2730920 RepID=A0A849IDN3_9HYPH|nr:DsbA family oxidoreductase [Enterovirga sp. DB1703]NNM74325.1 DsbA family oxidoreductase [Enterovirga sp. DB1703]